MFDASSALLRRPLLSAAVAGVVLGLVLSVQAGALGVLGEEQPSMVLAAEHRADLALVPAAPQPAADVEEPPAGADAAEVVHVVARGEGLADIAAAHGLEGIDAWRRLFDANPHVKDPDLLTVGERVRIPAPEEELARRDLPVPPRPVARSSRSAGGAGVWDRLARCESGGRWHLSTGNGYYGGLQFSLSSWKAVGGQGYPHEASREHQIAMAERLLARQGWGAWPSCARRLGLR